MSLELYVPQANFERWQRQEFPLMGEFVPHGTYCIRIEVDMDKYYVEPRSTGNGSIGGCVVGLKRKKDPKVAILDVIEKMLKFPYPQVCCHFVAGELLNELELCGLPVTPEFEALVRATVQADDERALHELTGVRKHTFFT